MKRFILITSLIAGILFFTGCGGTSTAPTPTLPTLDSIPIWTVEVNELTFSLGLADLIAGERGVAFVSPGSTMTAEQLRDYFCKAIIYAPTNGIPKSYQCAVYQIFRPAWNQIPDATVLAYVAMVESYGVDVPNIDPYNNPCG